MLPKISAFLCLPFLYQVSVCSSRANKGPSQELEEGLSHPIPVAENGKGCFPFGHLALCFQEKGGSHSEHQTSVRYYRCVLTDAEGGVTLAILALVLCCPPELYAMMETFSINTKTAAT